MTKYMRIKTNNAQGFILARGGDSITLQYPNSSTRRGRVGIQVCQTLDTGCNVGVFTDDEEDNPIRQCDAGHTDIP